MDFLIRKGLFEDYDMVNKLAFELYYLHHINRPDIFNKTDICFSKEAYFKELDDPKANIFVVEKDHNIIAYACFHLVNKRQTLLKCARNYVTIEDFVVSKSHRNNGVGKLLHAEIFKYARMNSCTSIELDVLAFNENAIDFYIKLGYTAKNYCFEYIIK